MDSKPGIVKTELLGGLDNETDFIPPKVEYPFQGRKSRKYNDATYILPKKMLSFMDFGEIFSHWQLLKTLVLRNICGRYRQMAFGPLWIILQPAIQMIIFTILLGKWGKLPSDGLPYPLFIFGALLPWEYFANTSKNCMSSLVSNMRLISKVYFPRLLVILAEVLTGLLDLVISSTVLIGLMLYYKTAPGLSVFILPLLLLMTMILAMGIGLWSAALAVWYRDLKFIFLYGLRLWMYLTPVVYTSKLIPSQLQFVYKSNPMYWVVEGFRSCLFNRPFAISIEIYMALVVSGVVFISGLLVFSYSERDVVDAL